MDGHKNESPDVDVKDKIVVAQIHPRILNPRMLKPRMVNPRILHPRMITARILNPRILNTRILHFSWIGLGELAESQFVIKYSRAVSIQISCKGSRTVSKNEETFGSTVEELAQALGELDLYLVAFLAILILKALNSVCEESLNSCSVFMLHLCFPINRVFILVACRFLCADANAILSL